jgi:hypothetical protein
MSNHRGPEGCAPDELRCAALVKGVRSTWYYEWTRHDHQCPRLAQQSRDGVAVCYIHANTKTLTKWEGTMNKHTQSPGTSGIKRDTKRANRAKKKAQYLANTQARAEANRSGPSKPRK